MASKIVIPGCPGAVSGAMDSGITLQEFLKLWVVDIIQQHVNIKAHYWYYFKLINIKVKKIEVKAYYHLDKFWDP